MIECPDNHTITTCVLRIATATTMRVAVAVANIWLPRVGAVVIVSAHMTMIGEMFVTMNKAFIEIKQEMINIIARGAAIIMLLILVAIALAHLIHIIILPIFLQAIILLSATHLTMIIRLASDLLLVLTNAICYKTMSMSDLAAQ